MCGVFRETFWSEAVGEIMVVGEVSGINGKSFDHAWKNRGPPKISIMRIELLRLDFLRELNKIFFLVSTIQKNVFELCFKVYMNKNSVWSFSGDILVRSSW